MKATITKHAFVTDMTREGYGFSREGARALFEYLETYEQDCETEIEYDPIAFRCEFTEYSDLEEIQGVCDSITDIEDLYDNTLVIEFEGGIIIEDF